MKKALLIGINYYGDGDMELDGCIDDVVSVKRMLMEKMGYREADIVMLRDDIDDVSMQPTSENIMKHLISTIRNSQNISEFWFHYSGHGSQFEDTTGEELDGKDELIIPVDYKENGIIHDDIFKEVTKYLKCKTMMVFDCCHSGTICDLPYHYDVVNDRMKHTVQDDEGCANKQIYKISGSRDDQVSLSMYDYEFGKMKGACTNALIRILDESGFDITMKELVMKMNKWMVKNGSEQCPTYATSDPSTLEHNMKDVFSVNVKVSGVSQPCEICAELEKMVETMRKEAEELKSKNAKLEKMNRDLRAENTRIQQSLTHANNRYNYCNNMLQRYKRSVNYLQRRVRYLTQLLRRRR